jgi:hypothetical protein
MHALGDLCDDAGLAHACCAEQHHYLPAAHSGAAPAIGEDRCFSVTRQERRQRATRLEAGDVPPADDLVGGDQICESLERSLRQVVVLEALQREPTRGVRDHDSAGLGHALQAGSEVGRLADHSAVVAMPCAFVSPTTTKPVAMPTRTHTLRLENCSR